MKKYVIHRIDDSCHKGYIYSGYDNNTHVGFVSGYIRPDNTIELQYGVIEKGFQGEKTVRCFKEMIDSIQKDFKNIVCYIDNKNNSALRVVLGNGFHIIGNKTVKGNISIELLKARRE